LLPGQCIQKFPSRTLPDGLLEKVENLVKVIHAHGVTHGDLHQKNIIVNEGGEIGFIDWASAQVFGAGQRNAAKERIFRELCILDRRAVAKLKCRHAPQHVTLQERDLLQRTTRLYSAAKKVSLIFAALRGRKHYHKAKNGKKFRANKFERRFAKHPYVGDNK
jgi:tRNA A-37 threonylcarbamoyl transferase component Bud32